MQVWFSAYYLNKKYWFNEWKWIISQQKPSELQFLRLRTVMEWGSNLNQSDKNNKLQQ